MRDFSSLDAVLADTPADGYLFDAKGASDQYYLSRFDAPDPFVALYTPEDLVLLVSGLEYGRATATSRADHVARYSDFDYRSLVEEYGEADARARMIAQLLAEHDVDSVLVPERFPIATGDGLRDQGITVQVDTEGYITNIRARKTEKEIDNIHATQGANETAMERAESLLREATVEDGTLYHDGAVLTSERVQQAIEIALLQENCALDETIVACGQDSADPHDRGSGPLLADEPIVVDIFPRSKETQYHADMTRTFLKGDPTAELARRYEVVKRAQEAAFDAIEPGTTGKAVHAAVCDVFEAEGFETLRSDPDTETGFIHGTGHGIGLDVHERPRINPNGEELKPGHVVTVEPGLYDPALGGIRIEDLVVVTDDGLTNLTDYPKQLVV